MDAAMDAVFRARPLPRLASAQSPSPPPVPCRTAPDLLDPKPSSLLLQGRHGRDRLLQFLHRALLILLRRASFLSTSPSSALAGRSSCCLHCRSGPAPRLCFEPGADASFARRLRAAAPPTAPFILATPSVVAACFLDHLDHSLLCHDACGQGALFACSSGNFR